MRLNKKECRKFTNPGMRMAAGCGLFHAQQIDYIIRTAVKIIDHHKTIILYVYSRQQAVKGDERPLWTVFQTKDDFITLARKEEGTTTWRTAGFENLENDWEFCDKCAFYSLADEERLGRYFKHYFGTGLLPLLKAQREIQECRRLERQRIRENAIIERMSVVPALPRGVKSWIHKSVMPAYFFYDYKRGGKDISGVCSSCGHEVRLSGVKQGKRGVCPHCKRELIMKPRSRRGYCMTDRDTCEVIQNVGNGEIVVRIIKARYTYTSDTPQMRIYENDRQFVRMDAEGKIHVENYYYSNGDGILTHWKAGEYPQFSQWQYSFEADTCGHLYCKNLPAALKDTPWQYCPVNDFYNYYYERMQVLPFLHAFQKHPRLEHLVKTGFCDIVSDLVYRYTPNCLDETQNRTHRILRVAAEDIPFLQELNTNLSLLHTFQGYAGMKERKRLLLWQMENKVERDILPILNYITVHKFIRYVDSQHGFLCLRKTPDGMLRYKKLQDVVSEYRDYLEMCHKLDYDMKNSFVLYPKDLQKSHDKVARRMKHKKDAELKQKFVSVYRQLSGQLEFETDGLKIIYPDTPDDVIKEGNALHHCVGSYVKRVADGECVILFLRKSAEVSKAFYTIEVRGQSVVQVRGKGNCSMTPEVEAFMEEWKRKVLCAPLSVAAA